ncbi:MAG: PAS domain S-box protein [Methylobacter sp.]
MFGLLMLASDLAHADNALEQWRSKAGEIRMLAENDTQRAYAEAGRLQADLPADATPSDRARLLNLLARIEVYQAQTEKAALHIQQAMELAKQHNDPVGQAEADLNTALNAVNQARIDDAIAAAIHSLSVLDGVDRPDLLGEALLRMAMMYRRTDQHDESITMSMQALDIARQSNNPLALVYAYQGLAIAYEQSDHFAEANEYYQRMQEQARIAGSRLMEAFALMGIGYIHNNRGDLKIAEPLIRDAIAVFRAIDVPFSVNFSQFALADNLHRQQRYAEALPIFDEIVGSYQRYPNKIGLWWVLNARSSNRIALGDITGARQDVEQAYKLAKEIGVPLYLTDSAKRLAEIAAAKGNHREAYRFMLDASDMAAKAAKDTAATRMLQLTRRYQTESKQREIDKLNRRNQQQASELKQQSLEQRWLWTVLGGSVIMLVGTGFFLMRLRRSHRKLATLNAQVLQAKNKLQATLDTIPDLLFEVGLDGRYYDYHSPQSELLAAPVDVLLTKTVSDVMPADAAAVCLASLHEAHRHGRSLGKQLLLPLPHGDFWFELSVAQKPGEAGEEPRFIVMSRDITRRKLMEEQALLREQEFRVLVENSPDLIFRYDKDCRRIYANPAVTRLVGKPSDALLNSTPSEAKILSDEQADRLMRVIRQVLSTGLPAESEVACFGADGQLHYFHNRYAPEFNAHNEAVGVISIARDVTERKHAVEILAAREREFRTLADNLPGNVVRYDNQGHRIYCNANMTKLVGAVFPQWREQSIEDMPPLVDSHSMAPYQAKLRHVLATGESAELEVLVTRVSGEKQIHNIRFMAERDEDGKIVGALAIGDDITERKHAAEALAAREREFRTLAESLPDNVVRYDREGRVIYVNPVLEKALGAIASKMLGTTVRERFPNGEYDDYAQLLDSVLAGGESGEIEKIVIPPYSDLHLVHSIRMVAERDENGEVIGVLAIGRDITERKQAEQRLWLMDFALNQVGEAVYIIDMQEHRFLNVNAEASRALGYSPEELLRLTLYDIDPDADPEEMENLQRKIDATDLSVFERRHKTKDGRIFPVEINAQVFDYQGRPTSIALARDISERKRIQHDIALMSQALSKVHEAAYIMDNNARFLYINDESCRALGYSRDELLALSVMDIGPGWSLEMVREVWQYQRDTGTVQSFEATHRRKDGSIFPVEINANQFEYDGKTYGLALVRDITDRKLVEDEIRALNAGLEQRVLERTEALRLQTRYLRALIDTLPMMAWLKDTENRFLVVNQALATASSRNMDDLVGKSSLAFWPPELAEAYHADDAEVMATGLRKTVEESFIDARDGTIWIETSKAPVFDEDGSVLGTVGIAYDISDRRALERARESALAEAERLAKLRSEFMARMSHELRTPLNGIMGYAQILLGENRGNERHSAMLNVIQQSGEYLLNLINDILDFAKIEAGKQELTLSDIRLPCFLRNLASIITIKTEQKGLVFVCDIAADVPAGIRADETRLRQVLLNLLSNAVKYTERGQISLRVSLLESNTVDLSNTKPPPEGEGAKVPAATILEPARLRFEVQDNGVGIDTGQLETIFQAFEQAGDWQRRTGGTGLGLPISRELVRMMASDIHVSSRVGEGSTFWFELDVPVVKVCDDITVAERPITGYQGLRRRVLVVDDVNENRALLIDILSRLDFETFEATNGRECLDSVETQMPDLILLDMVMPEMDGLETARRLRSLPGFEQTPIIAVSASASGTDVAEAMKAGVNVFLSKPIDIKRLMAQLAGLLKLDWIYALSETGEAAQQRLNEPLVVPPPEEMKILHRLAQEGSMRDIIGQAAYLSELDDRYRPFAEQLHSLAKGYQSRAILELVERHITIHPQIGTDAD